MYICTAFPVTAHILGIRQFTTIHRTSQQYNQSQISIQAFNMVTKPATCCGRSESCLCAEKATCSCGKQSAVSSSSFERTFQLTWFQLECNCEKAATENSTSGARCSCNMRPKNQCSCDRAAEENKSGPSSTENETDFTGKA